MTDGSSVVLMLRMILSLAIVLGLVVAFSRALQRRQGGRVRRARQQATAIDVVARQNLSRTASVHIVQVGDQALVLGVSDAGIRLLDRLPATPQPPGDDESDAERDDAAGSAQESADAGDGLPTRADRRRAASSHPAADQLTRAAARQADEVAQIIAAALGRVGRRRG